MKTSLKVIVLGFFSGLAGSYTGYHYLIEPLAVESTQPSDFHTVNYNWPGNSTISPAAMPAVPNVAEDFSEAASRATPSVVYINSISQGVSSSNWDWFFGEMPGRQTKVSSGSEVIFTADGYIVTNNHVIASD